MDWQFCLSCLDTHILCTRIGLCICRKQQHLCINFICLYSFFIAGILIAYTADGRNVWSWWKKKVTKLIIPYVILTLIAWIPKCILGSYMTDNMEVSLSNFVRILLIPREGIWGHFWFIPTYLVITLLCAYVYKITTDKPLTWGGVLLIGTVLTIFPIPVGWFAIQDISIELLYSMLGMFLCGQLVKRRVTICRWQFGIISLVFSLILYVSDIGIIGDKIISILMIYFVMTVSVFLSSYFEMKGIRYIGIHAFTIYIYSWPIQVVIEMILTTLLNCSWYVIYFCMFAAGLIGPLLVYEIYCRFIPGNWLFNAMIGVKK